MGKVAVVTDSTSYLPESMLKEFNISVAPQVLIWGDQTYRDGVDIQPSEFYTRLQGSKVMPSTSQVAVKDFHSIFERLVKEDYQVLAVLISNKLSGTIASAIQAKESFPKATIEIVDSATTAMALGFVALTTARAAAQGASMEECKSLAEHTSKNVGVMFTVETLEFLHRGGRIGGAQRLLGAALNMKPILEVVNGRVEAVERIRTRKKALERLKELVEIRIDGRSPIHLASIHANAPEEAQQLLTDTSSRLSAVETIQASLSPVVGNHAGPGAVGLAYMAGI